MTIAELMVQNIELECYHIVYDFSNKESTVFSIRVKSDSDHVNIGMSRDIPDEYKFTSCVYEEVGYIEVHTNCTGQANTVVRFNINHARANIKIARDIVDNIIKMLAVDTTSGLRVIFDVNRSEEDHVYFSSVSDLGLM